MRLTRVHVPVPLSAGASIELPAGAGQHLVRVLRMKAGDALRVFDGSGGEHEAVITAERRGVVTVQVGARHDIDRESPLQVTLLQGIARGEKMDLILQKATELGVTRFVPLTSVRSNVRLDAATTQKKLAHWRAVVAGACEQSGRNQVPEVDAPLGLASAAQQASDGLKLLLTPDGDSRSLRALLDARTGARPPAVTLLVGPEGGFDPAEACAAKLAGFASCRLGPRVLRTETAALTALAALQALAGDLA